MRIKLDENLGKQEATLFRDAGHDVETVPQQGLCGATDRQLLMACQGDERCLVTLDMDFGNPLLFKPWEYAGIAVLRLPAKPTPTDLWDACRTLIAGLTGREIIGKLWIVQRGRIREYQPDRENEPDA